MRTSRTVLIGLVVLVTWVVATTSRADLLGGLLGGPSPCTGSASQCATGIFGEPFAEPTIDGTPTAEMGASSRASRRRRIRFLGSASRS